MQLPLTTQAVFLMFKTGFAFPGMQCKIPKDPEKEGNKRWLEKHVFF